MHQGHHNMQGMAYSTSAYSAGPRSAKLVSAGLIVALHAAALVALWQLESVRSAITAAAPIMVSLIEPARPKVEPKIEPPKPVPPKPRVHREPPRVAPAPILAAAPEAPTTQVAPPPVPIPLPPIETPPPPPAPAVAVAAPPAPPPVTAPRFNADYLNNPPPSYPPISRRMGEEGKVVLRVHVNERGLPDDVQIRTSSGFTRLDATAQETVRQWKFVPARQGKEPVSAWVLVPISFSLRS
jgi:protein TonB